MLQSKVTTSESKYNVNQKNQPKPFSYIPDSPDVKKTAGNESDLFKISLKTDQQESLYPTHEKIPRTNSPPRNIDLDQDIYVYENAQQPKTYQRITCNFCNTRQETFTIYLAGKNTYLVMVLIIFLFLPLFWVPLLLNECKDKVSICSVCNRATGIIPFRIF